MVQSSRWMGGSVRNLEDLSVESQFEPYQVTFSESVHDFRGHLPAGNNDLFFIVDLILLEIYPELIRGLTGPIYVVNAKESQKTIQTVAEIYQWLLDSGATKSSVIVAIGGGIVQDLTTFVAATYYRGVSWHLIPTTLLSMSDSCIGGKCALNHGGFKNQIGIIWPPKSVLINQAFLSSLPENQIKSGYGEILKLSLTGKGQFYENFKSFVRQHGFTRTGILPIIRASLDAKKAIIEEDETETGLRRVLNYGHTFGHALEAASGNDISHGEAIVLGMDLVNFLGVEYGITSKSFAEDFREFALEQFDLAQLREVAKKYSNEMYQLSLRDKKVLHKKLHLAIAVDPGNLIIHPVDMDQSLRELIQRYLHEK